LLLAGSAPERRVSTLLRNWYVAIPAVVLPLLLYLYLPIRSSQQPLMNWGTPDNLGDFWRHITGWQYRAYAGIDLGGSIPLLGRYITQQWAWVTPIILVASAGGAMLMALRHRPLFAAILTTAAATLLFAIFYNISEIEPYLVPMYMMLLLWVGSLPETFSALRGAQQNNHETSQRGRRIVYVGAASLVALLAIVGAFLIYPLEDHSDDHLAEQFANNVFSELPEGSVLLTDYWDFYAPTIYLQNVLGVRPDVAVVDTSLLVYPWYVGYLQKYRPTLLSKAQDILPVYQREQRRWVNGEILGPNQEVLDPKGLERLDSSYLALVTSFVEADPNSTGYTLFQQTQNEAKFAPEYVRQPVGLVSKLVKSPAPTTPALPQEPNYKLDGILTGPRVPMDDFARLNSCRYVQAYSAVAQQYAALHKDDVVQGLADKATAVRQAIPGNCQ